MTDNTPQPQSTPRSRRQSIVVLSLVAIAAILGAIWATQRAKAHATDMLEAFRAGNLDAAIAAAAPEIAESLRGAVNDGFLDAMAQSEAFELSTTSWGFENGTFRVLYDATAQGPDGCEMAGTLQSGIGGVTWIDLTPTCPDG